jgi:16S rRNA (uracil1498-N3)-methyltransferase
VNALFLPATILPAGVTVKSWIGNGRRVLLPPDLVRATQLRQALTVGRRMPVLIDNLAHCSGEILSHDPVGTVLELKFMADPMPRLPLELIVGLARPQTMKKVIQLATELGVKALHLVRCAQTEKSYLDSNLLTPGELEQLTILGREQGIDCCAPEIIVHERFKPFVEDRLAEREQALKANSVLPPCKIIGCTKVPKDDKKLPQRFSCGFIAVGPELGWNEFERELLVNTGFIPCSLGPRTLRVENALPLLVGSILNGVMPGGGE